MAIRYRFNILERLKKAGYNTNYIRLENLFSQSTLQKFRHGVMVSLDNINTLCFLLECQPGDILEYVPGDDTDKA